MNGDKKNDINHLTDVLDRLTLDIYEIENQKHPLYYLDALTKVLRKINQKTDDFIYHDDQNEDTKVLDLIKKYNDEEIQQALLLLEIKAAKHQNYALDMLIPDGVGILSAFILAPWVDINQDITVIFGNMGFGQFALTHNFVWQHPRLIINAIENDNKNANYLIEKAKLLNQKIRVFHELEWKKQKQFGDIIIGDARSEIVASPHSFIQDIENSSNAKISLYLVDDDFFFNKAMEQISHLEAFILLPDTFFQNVNHKKAFLMLTKERKNEAMAVFSLPDWRNTQEFKQVIDEILRYLRR